MIAAHPVLGVGFGAFATAYPQYGEHDSVEFQVAQAHNDYLQILADCGAVGGLLALWFIALLARSVWRGVQHQDARLAAWCLGAGGGIFALMVHSIFDFNLQLPSNAMLFLFLSALVSVLGVSPSVRPESLSSTGRLATL
jgi:O-antigen ligase